MLTGIVSWRDLSNSVSNVTGSVTVKDSVYLRNGTYFLSVCCSDWYSGALWDATGGYELSTSFMPAETSYNVRNNSFETAADIQPGKDVNGVIDCEEEQDIYSFTVPGGEYKITLTADDTKFSYNVYIYDSDGQRIWSKQVRWENILKTTESVKLEAGDYYAAICDSSKKGIYSFKIQKNDAESNKTVAESKKKAFITVRKDGKEVKAITVKKGKKVVIFTETTSDAKMLLSSLTQKQKKIASVKLNGNRMEISGKKKGTILVKLKSPETAGYQKAAKTIKIRVT